MSKHSQLEPVPAIDLGRVHGGKINFSSPEAAIQQVRERAATCRALHAETQRLAGGREPVAGSDAYAMQMATRACWQSLQRP